MGLPEEIVERRARNELRFREVNERIREVASPGGDEPLIVLCECGRPECLEQIDIAAAGYEAVRADGRRFVVTPGHVSPDLEHVVLRERGYLVVEKTSDAAELAERHDPRD